MSSTLYFRKSPPKKPHFGACKHPLKSIFARKFYERDGSLSEDMLTLGADELGWLQGLRDGRWGNNSDQKTLDKIVKLIEEGHTVDMWIAC